MGRPLNHRYFGDLNFDITGKDVGGENVVSVAVTGTFGGKTPATYDIPASVISAPQIAGGAKPTLTLTYLTASTATVAVVTGGSGYTSAPTITGAALQALGGAGTGTIILTATLNTALTNAITCTAYIPLTGTAGNISGNGTGAQTNSDIVRQVATRSFVVQSSDGVGRCTLKATAASAAGEMNIIATDSATGTYYVTKLTNRKAWITRGTGTEFATGDIVAWTFGTAVLNTSVKITNG